MKLTISNIAWNQNEDMAVYELMRSYGFKGLDIAPTRLFDDPFKTGDEILENVRNDIRTQGFQIVGLQSLLYGHPELEIFKSIEIRNNTFEFLKKVMLFASKLDAKTLVFGNPKNRMIGESDRTKSYEIAIEFFYELGKEADKNNLIFCIEPNAKEYGTDFINTTMEGLELVKKVNNEGFKLIMDTSTLFMNKEDYSKIIRKAINYIGHVHISEPSLLAVPLKENMKHHAKISKILKEIGYDKWIAIEMKKKDSGSNIAAIKSALAFVAEIYS